MLKIKVNISAIACDNSTPFIPINKGSAIITGIIGIFAKKKNDTNKDTSIIQKNGKDSINIQNNSFGSKRK